MFDSTQFTKAALIIIDTEREIEKLLGVKISLQFEIIAEKKATAQDVIRIVSVVTNHSVADLMDRMKTNDICYARYACYYIMRIYLKMTYEQIGDSMLKNHSTVMAGLQVVNDQISNRVLHKIIEKSEDAFLKWIGK